VRPREVIGDRKVSEAGIGARNLPSGLQKPRGNRCGASQIERRAPAPAREPKVSRGEAASVRTPSNEPTLMCNDVEGESPHQHEQKGSLCLP
jgi:hypothetical protein